jgi:ABC-2 type transport system permease protein
MSWLRIREMVRKEFIQLFRDPKNRVVLVLAPLIQLLVFGYVVNYDIKDIRVALIDQAQTRESRLLADAFTAGRIFRITHRPTDSRGMEELFLAGKADIGIRIPPDFSSLIRRGETAAVQIIADGSMSNMAATSNTGRSTPGSGPGTTRTWTARTSSSRGSSPSSSC